MTWNNYDPDNPPGEDDWPIWGLINKRPQLFNRNSIMSWGHLENTITHWHAAIVPTPPEPELPALYLGGEEIQFEEQLNGWRVSSKGNVYVDNLDNYSTQAEAHAAVVEMLGSFRVGDHEVVLIDRELPPWESRYKEAERCVKEIREQWAAETERRESAERVVDMCQNNMNNYGQGARTVRTVSAGHRANYPKEGE